MFAVSRVPWNLRPFLRRPAGLRAQRRSPIDLPGYWLVFTACKRATAGFEFWRGLFSGVSAIYRRVA
jgi:hypothetical protein